MWHPMASKLTGFLLLGIGLLMGCQSTTSAPGSVLAQLPDTVRAGTTLRLKSIRPDRYVVVQTSYETLLVDQNPGVVRATHAGKYRLKVIHNQSVVEQKLVTVLPDTPQKAVLLVGAKSIVADGKSTAMAVLISEDNFHNIALLPAQFSALRPNHQIETHVQQPHHLIVYQRLTSQTLAGKTLVSARIGRAQTTAKEITEVAGPPVDFSISPQKIIPFADDNQFFVVKTNGLQDEFGNIVEDGTLVDLYCTDAAGGARKLTAYTLNGLATWLVKNPARPGLLSVQSQAAGARSNQVRLVFADKRQSAVSLEKP
jgi:hypothetical protein